MKVFIAQLSRGSIDVQHLKCLDELMGSGPGMLVRVSGITNIPTARNALANRFLEQSNCDVLLWVDDDMVFDGAQVRRMCSDACVTESIIGAAYTTKGHPCKINVDMRLDIEEMSFFQHGKLYRVNGVGTGLCAVHRSVFEKVATTTPKTTSGYDFFHPITVDGVRYGEDIAFCREAAEKHFITTFCDTRVRAGHIGKYVYHIEDYFTPPRKLVDGVTLQFGEKAQ